MLFIVSYSQKLIKSLEVPREPLHQIQMQYNQWFIKYRTTSFLSNYYLGKMSTVGQLVFNEIFPEVDQIIRNTQRSTTCDPTNGS